MKLIDRVIQNSYFVFNKPAILKPLLKNYLKMAYTENVLRTVDIVLEYRCNLKCSHCYATDFDLDGQEPMVLSDILNTVDKCCDDGAIHFNVIGGEPTLSKDLFKLINYMHKKPSIISLATNGWMIDENYAKNLKASGLDVVLLSLDSLDEKEHDNIRGKGSYERAMRALEYCLKIKLKIYISTVVTQKNLRDGSMKKLEGFCDDKQLLLHVNLPALYGMWKGKDELFFNDEDQGLVEKLYEGKSIRSCEMSSYGASRCRSGKEKLHITAYGDVMPCTFIPISFGNINNDKLSVIRERMYNFPFISEDNRNKNNQY